MILEPSKLRELSLGELKKQYTKTRGKMQKRKDRLDIAGFDTNYQHFVDKWNHGGKIPTITSLRESTGDNEQQLKNSMIYIIAELERYAEDDRTLVSYLKEQRNEMAERLRESGYNVSNEDMTQFIYFMDWMHNSNLDHALYTETYEVNEKGYGRSKRRERTEAEKANVMTLFEEWKKNKGYMSEEFYRKYLT